MRQNQDLAKSCKNQFFNTFLIRIWIEKNHSPKPKYCQKLKKHLFNTFLIRIWIENNIHQNQNIAKSWKNIFSILFQLEFE